MNNKEIKEDLQRLKQQSKEYHQALKIIEKYGEAEDEYFKKKRVAHLKKFEGRYYKPTLDGRIIFEKVIKVDDKGTFDSEVIIIDIEVSKRQTIFESGLGEHQKYDRTFVGGTGADPKRDEISEKYYNNVITLIQKFKNDLEELSPHRRGSK